MKTFAKAAVAVAFVTAGVMSYAALAQTGLPGNGANDNLGEMDYGVCRGTNVACYHNWARPAGANSEWRVLLFTKTAGPRHANIGTPLKEGLNPALADNNVVQRELGKLLAANNIKMDYTEDSSVLTSSINSYHAVIFFSTSRDNLDDAAQTALRQYMRRGGGFVGVHNAFGTEYNWPYYEGLLGGANYFDHPGGNRDGQVVIKDNKDTSTKGLPARFDFRDEWYNLIPFPTKVRFLATVENIKDNPVAEGGGRGGAQAAGRGAPAEGAAPAAAGRGGRGGDAAAAGGRGGRAPSVTGTNPGHGSYHPVAWCQYYDGGKAWLTTLGHDGNAWTDPNFAGGKEFKAMLLGGIKSAMGMEPFCQ